MTATPLPMFDDSQSAHGECNVAMTRSPVLVTSADKHATTSLWVSTGIPTQMLCNLDTPFNVGGEVRIDMNGDGSLCLRRGRQDHAPKTHQKVGRAVRFRREQSDGATSCASRAGRSGEETSDPSVLLLARTLAEACKPARKKLQQAIIDSIDLASDVFQ